MVKVKIIRKSNKKIEHKMGSFASNRLYDNMTLAQRVFSNENISLKIFKFKEDLDRLEVRRIRNKLAWKLCKNFNPPVTRNAKRAGTNRCTDEYIKSTKRWKKFRRFTGRLEEEDIAILMSIRNSDINNYVNRKIIFQMMSDIYRNRMRQDIFGGLFRTITRIDTFELSYRKNNWG